MAIIGEAAKVLITVKTSPQPSTRYGDTVCVAGIRIDSGRHDWVRLYPIPFRYLDSDQKFKKYDVVELTIRRRQHDGRAESYSPEWDSIRIVEHLEGWPDRVPVLNEVQVTSTCDLRANTIGSPNGPSLGFVGVEDVSALNFETHAGWSAAERLKIAQSLEQLDLFGELGKPPKLIAPRFKVKYRYRCSDKNCPGHDGQILDWELTELERRFRADTDAELKRKVTDKYLTMMFAPKRQTRFFMGNFEAPTKRDKFSVLGVYYPPAELANQRSLF